MIKDLTVGKPTKVLFFFTLPMLLGNIFQQLYNVVDSIVVGRFVGADALAAVGAAFPVVFLALAITMGTSMGCSVVISQYFGSHQYKKLKSAITTTLIAGVGVGAILTIIGLLVYKPLLALLQTPNNIIGDAYTYLYIYFFGLIAFFLFQSLSSVFSALGDSKTPLYFLIVSTTINIVLDFYFVLSLGMGVAGVAIATVIAEVVAAIGLFIKLKLYFKKLVFNEDEAEVKAEIFDLPILKQMATIAVPSVIQQSLVCIGIMAIQGLVNSYGSNVIAGYTAATRIDTIAMMPMMNISMAISTYTAQNIGAGKIERIRQGFNAGVKMMLVFGIFITAVIFLFGSNLMGLFVDMSKTDPQVVQIGINYLQVVSVFYILMGTLFSANGVLRGAGDMRFFMFSTILGFGTRIAAAYVLAAFIGVAAIWWSVVIGWLAGAIIAVWRYKSGLWQDKAAVQKPEHALQPQYNKA
ncbi:MAG: MATE family efflux transporter [Clostridia bacterium]|nr:MATE family efflux transporter [Clostridia bacterium]